MILQVKSIGVPGVVEQAKRMKTDEHSAETDWEGTAARLLKQFLAYCYQAQV